jgi:radical SAM superfamily enzyme YgiQ (UPF0313 family)
MDGSAMRVLFSNPPWWVTKRPLRIPLFGAGKIECHGVRAGSRWPFTQHGFSRPDRHVFGDYVPYPFFMGYAASYLARKTGAKVALRDSIVMKESYRSYFKWLDAQRFDYIFVESASPSWDHDVQVMREIKRRRPEAKIVVTGPIATMGPKILEEAPLVAAIKGEYEKGAVKVVNGSEGIIDFDLMTLDEMNAAPFPYYDDVIATQYNDGNPKGTQFPQAQVWSSRGCPYKCIFCVWPAAMTGNDPDGTQKRSVRQYTPEYMEAFLSELVNRYGFKTIYFDDDTFNIGNRHVERMAAVMRKIGVPWSAMCRADTISLDTWQLMKDSGCFGVKLGFESGNQYVVDKIVNKHLDLDYARQAVTVIKKVGMTVHGTFTYGLPGETPEQMQDTKRYLHSLGLDTWQESGAAEIEGAPLHTLARKGSLGKYEGAQVDGGYQRAKDGNVKFQDLARQLQSGNATGGQISVDS